MSLRLSILMQSDNRQAKAGTKELRNEIKGLGTEARAMSTSASTAARGVDAVGRAADGAEAQVQQLTAAQMAQAAASRQVANANRAAAGSVANLTAQGNDLLVMVASGQSPWLLAAQQGTQINQVFTQLGGGKAALRGIGQAALAMVSPLSLATLATIAGGAALIQWATSAKEAKAEATALAEAMEGIRQSTQEARDAVALFNSGLRSQEQLTVMQQIRAIEAEISTLEAQRDARSGRNAQAIQFRINARQAELQSLQQLIAENNTAVSQEERLQRIREKANDAAQRIIAKAEAERRAREEAQQTLNVLQNQADINRLIAQYGDDSVQVTRERVQQEREAFLELTNSRDMSDQLKQQLIAAWDAANGVASVDMAGNISLAANEAGRLAENLARAIALNPITPAQRDEDAVFAQPVLQDASGRQNQREAASNFQRIISRGSSGGGGGGGGGGRTAEVDATQRLIEKLQTELAVLQETDPVQKEMLRNRVALKDATEAEKEKISDLISQRIAEQETLERSKRIAEGYQSALSGGLDALFDKSKSTSDVLKQLVLDLLKATLQAEAFNAASSGGSGGGGGFLGLLGGLFGGGGGGSRAPSVQSVSASAPTAANVPSAPSIAKRNPAAAAGQGSSGTMNVNISLEGARGNQEIEQASQRGTQKALEIYDREVLPGRVTQIQQNPRAVG
ncbi:MAG: phage tail length tape measure family protein [Paracoccaceae bacterium]